MKKGKRLIIQLAVWIFLLAVSSSACFSQNDSLVLSNSFLALEKAEESRIALDEDKPQLSLRLMQEAMKLEPSNFIYAFEVGQLQYILKSYTQSVETLQDLIDHPDVTPQYFQILGNAFYMTKNKMAAKEIFDIGLSHFPKSGVLFLEKGNLASMDGETGQALFNYLKGIELDPNYALNYYKAAIIYFDQAEVVNGIVLGETFMNLDKTSPFHELMGLKLFQQYQKCIQIQNTGNWSTHFCNPLFEDDAISLAEFKSHPSRCIAYASIVKSVSHEGIADLNINAISTIRQRILEMYLQPLVYDNWQEDILDYQKIIFDNQHFEAYNHWIFRAAQPEQFEEWRKQNAQKWADFCEWYNRFQLEFPEP
jgi:tetratricopeptide (TPR) repeat protein